MSAADITPQLIEEMVYNAFRRVWEKNRWVFTPPHNRIYVTEVTQCPLKAWLNRTIGGPTSKEKMVVLILGDDVHYLLQNEFPLGLAEKSYEKKYGDITIVGRVDREMGDVLLEFKTASRIPGKALSHHVDQMQLYFWLTGKERGFIVYVAKTNGQVKAFEVRRDEERISELLERAAELSRSLAKGKPPLPRLSEEEKWQCRYCEFTDYCPLAQGRGSASAPPAT